jgi:hypothetical protein
MPAPIAVPVRHALWNRCRQGCCVATLAKEFDLAPRTVRHLLRRFRERGPDGFGPSYEHCGQRRSAKAQRLVEKAVDLRRQHPQWGAVLIRLMLDDEDAPGERTLQRCLAAADLAPALAGRRPQTQSQRADRPHAVWQMDAAEQMLLANGQRVSWLRLIDECSGAVLQTTIFPPRLLDASSPWEGAERSASGLSPLGSAGAFIG